VHCFYSERFLVTVHRDDCPAFAEIHPRYQKRAEAIERPSLLLYRIVDGLVDSFFPILDDFDDRIDVWFPARSPTERASTASARRARRVPSRL
jgi:magnesium transporter